MKLAIFNRAYEFIRPRLTRVFLVSVVYGVPVYALTWYSGLFDDLSVRLLLSVLVAMMPVEELLSAPKPWKWRGDPLFFALFIVFVYLFAIRPQVQFACLVIECCYVGGSASMVPAGLATDGRQLAVINRVEYLRW